METELVIIPFEESPHSEQVVELWTMVFAYKTPHNEPGLSVRKKLGEKDGLFFVASAADGSVIGTVMCGYDGHRGWIYSLAVSPTHRRIGVGKALMDHAEATLKNRGCLKINLQINGGNSEVEGFYHKLGYSTEPRISMGKVL